MKRSIIRMITILYRKSQSCLSPVLCRHNLTTAEQPFFATLQRFDGVTQDELSSLTSIDKAAAARAVKSLEDKGYVARVQDDCDKRQNRVFLTDAGRECWPRVESDLIGFNGLIEQGIAEADLEVVYGALLQMEENVKRLLKNKLVTSEEQI